MAPISKRTVMAGPWSTAGYPEAATFTTSLTGTNNDLTYTSKSASASGNTITITYVVAGVSTPLTVAVVGSAITVNVATSAGSAATSTATQVKTAVDASVPASALVSVANATGNDGTGVVTAMAVQTLAGGRTGETSRGAKGWGRKPFRGKQGTY